MVSGVCDVSGEVCPADEVIAAQSLVALLSWSASSLIKGALQCLQRTETFFPEMRSSNTLSETDNSREQT